MIEEVDLCADHADSTQQGKEFLALALRTKIAPVFPKPELDVLLIRIINQLAHLGFGPTLPDSFHHVVFKSQLPGKARKLSDSFERVFPAIKISPHRTA